MAGVSDAAEVPEPGAGHRQRNQKEVPRMAQHAQFDERAELREQRKADNLDDAQRQEIVAETGHRAGKRNFAIPGQQYGAQT